MRNDRQARKRADGIHGREQFFEIAESFQDERSTPRSSSAAACSRKMSTISSSAAFADLPQRSQRPDGTRNEHFVFRGFASFSRDFHAARIELGDAIAHAQLAEFVAIGAESIGLDDLRAGFDIGLCARNTASAWVDVQFFDRALRAHCFIEQRSHRAVGDEHRLFQPLLKSSIFIVVGSPQRCSRQRRKCRVITVHTATLLGVR